MALPVPLNVANPVVEAGEAGDAGAVDDDAPLHVHWEMARERESSAAIGTTLVDPVRMCAPTPNAHGPSDKCV